MAELKAWRQVVKAPICAQSATQLLPQPIEQAAKMMVTLSPNANELHQLLARVLVPATGAQPDPEAPAAPVSSLIIP